MSALLGAAISMAQSPWYRSHVQTAAQWGITALEDQQLAGLIMWVPAGFVYLFAALPQISRMLQPSPDALSATITDS